MRREQQLRPIRVRRWILKHLDYRPQQPVVHSRVELVDPEAPSVTQRGVDRSGQTEQSLGPVRLFSERKNHFLARLTAMHHARRKRIRINLELQLWRRLFESRA